MMADIHYFQSVGWKPPGVDALVILVHPGLASVAKRWGSDAPVYITEWPHPDWLGRLRVVPQTYTLAADRTVADWAKHLPPAMAEFREIDAQLVAQRSRTSAK